MKRVLVLAILAVVAGIGFAARGAAAQEKKAKSATEQEARWHGIIIRSDKDASTLTVRKGNIERTVHYDSSTKWTKQNKDATMDEFKDGADVIVLGKFDDSGVLQATRVDLRRP